MNCRLCKGEIIWCPTPECERNDPDYVHLATMSHYCDHEYVYQISKATPPASASRRKPVKL